MSTFTGSDGIVYNIVSSTPNYVYIGVNPTSYATQNVIIQNTVTNPNNSTVYTVTGISNNAFKSNTNIINFDISLCNTLTTIGSNAFQDCFNLSSFKFPASLQNINNYAFYSCFSLSSIIFPSNNNITTIGTGAFNSCPLNNFNFSSSLTSIGNNAFSGNYMSSINLSQCINVTILNFGVFSASRNCTSLLLPPNLTKISSDSFINCSALNEVILPASLSNMSEGRAFLFCSNLRSVTFSGTTIPSLGGNSFSNIAGSTAYYQYGTTNASTLTSSGYFTNYIIQNAPPPPPPIICFKIGTKIQTDKGYLPIENLKKGDLVKTLRDGFKPITMIGKRDVYHVASTERIKDQLYKCSQNEFPEIFEPLVITGCHCILVDDFVNPEYREKMIQLSGDIYVTDNKYRLPACIDERTTVYETAGTYTIYHFALEHPDYLMNYGIFANGLLVETCSERNLKELSGMELIE